MSKETAAQAAANRNARDRTIAGLPAPQQTEEKETIETPTAPVETLAQKRERELRETTSRHLDALIAQGWEPASDAFAGVFGGHKAVAVADLQKITGVTWDQIFTMFLNYCQPGEVKDYSDLVKAIEAKASTKSGAKSAIKEMIKQVRSNLESKGLVKVQKGKGGGIALNPNYRKVSA